MPDAGPDTGTDAGPPPCIPRFGDCSAGGSCCEPYTCEPSEDGTMYSCREVIK